MIVARGVNTLNLCVCVFCHHIVEPGLPCYVAKMFSNIFQCNILVSFARVQSACRAFGALDLAANRYALYTFVKFRSRSYGGGFVTGNLHLCHKPDFLVHLLYQVRQLNSVNL